MASNGSMAGRSICSHSLSIGLVDFVRRSISLKLRVRSKVCDKHDAFSFNSTLGDSNSGLPHLLFGLVRKHSEIFRSSLEISWKRLSLSLSRRFRRTGASSALTASATNDLSTFSVNDLLDLKRSDSPERRTVHLVGENNIKKVQTAKD